ncbi:MAG: aldehyde dehydrogenase family protein [Candidatus Promineifilaceae bacterium]
MTQPETIQNRNGDAPLLETYEPAGKQTIIPFINPATGEQFGSVPETSQEAVHKARKEMGAAAAIWAAKPIDERVRILRKLQEVVIDSLDEITAVINKDHGKSRQEAWAEVFMTTDKMHHYNKKAPEWLGVHKVSGGRSFLLSLSRKYFTEAMPFGVVAIIGPWNYPFELVVPAMYSALLAGNTVLVKPSEVSAATGVMIENLVRRVPELTPFVRFLHGGPDVGAGLVQTQPDLIFLTGSVSTGLKVAQAAAERMIPFLCELGGKDPMIVLGDADIKAAARWAVWGGAAFNTGQTCVAVERIYAVKEIYDEFVAAVIAEAKKVAIGYSPEKNNLYDMGPLTFDRQVRIITDHLQDAQEKGARIVYGGTIDGMFMEPTVVVDVDHSMKLMKEETFGPVLPIMKVDDEPHAILMANDSKFGLGAYVWSRSEKHAQRVAEQLQAGVININDVLAHYAVPDLPFGGVKLSGNARTHGKEEVMQFTQPRSWAVGPPPLPFDPVTIVRSNNQYAFGTFLLHVLFGVTPRQRVAPLTEYLEKGGRKRKLGLAALLAAGISVLAGSLRLLIGRKKA